MGVVQHDKGKPVSDAHKNEWAPHLRPYVDAAVQLGYQLTEEHQREPGHGPGMAFGCIMEVIRKILEKIGSPGVSESDRYTYAICAHLLSGNATQCHNEEVVGSAQGAAAAVDVLLKDFKPAVKFHGPSNN